MVIDKNSEQKSSLWFRMLSKIGCITVPSKADENTNLLFYGLDQWFAGFSCLCKTHPMLSIRFKCDLTRSLISSKMDVNTHTLQYGVWKPPVNGSPSGSPRAVVVHAFHSYQWALTTI